MHNHIYKLIPIVVLLASCDDPSQKAGEKKQRIIERFDQDKDGQLNEKERAAARQARTQRTQTADKELSEQEKRQLVIKKFDKDGDGKLNQEERAQAREFIQARKSSANP